MNADSHMGTAAGWTIIYAILVVFLSKDMVPYTILLSFNWCSGMNLEYSSALKSFLLHWNEKNVSLC